VAANRNLPVYIFGSEDDVDRAFAEGLLATCQVLDRAFPEIWGDAGRCLECRDAIVVTSGSRIIRRHAARVADMLLRSVRTVRIVRLPGVPPDGGLIEFLEGGGTVTEFEALAAASPLVIHPQKGRLH
jgi:hypothetical protein